MIVGQIDPFLERMLDVTARRQEAIAANISNIDTPGYKAQDVDFQKELAASLQESNGPSSPVQLVETEGRVKPNGNNVDLEHEMTEMSRNGMQYVMLVQMLSSSVKSLRYSISEGNKG